MVRLSCGRDIDVCPDINKCLKESNRSQFVFSCFINLIIKISISFYYRYPIFNMILNMTYTKV